MANVAQNRQPQTTYQLTGLTHTEKQRLMVLSVLEQKRGRELQREAEIQGRSFGRKEWQDFKTQFRAKYSEKSIEVLMQIAHRYYGLSTIQAVADVHNRLKANFDRRKRDRANQSA
jgi:hypothetical protein